MDRTHCPVSRSRSRRFLRKNTPGCKKHVVPASSISAMHQLCAPRAGGPGRLARARGGADPRNEAFTRPGSSRCFGSVHMRPWRHSAGPQGVVGSRSRIRPVANHQGCDSRGPRRAKSWAKSRRELTVKSAAERPDIRRVYRLMHNWRPRSLFLSISRGRRTAADFPLRQGGADAIG